MSLALIFALFISLLFTSIQTWVLQKKSCVSVKVLFLVGILIFSKFILSSTTGHLDIYRFIVFLKSWLADPLSNPWTYARAHQLSDFPYPPLMMYLHAAFFLPFRALLDLSPPFAPEALSFTLIKLPLFLADTLWVVWALEKSRAPTPLTLLFVVFNPMVVFHQFYSGQFDWVVIVLFFFSLGGLLNSSLTFTRNNLVSGVQFALKPFAFMFLPLLTWDRWLGDKRQALLLSAKFCLILLAARLTEVPFLFSGDYRQQMGRGASKLLARHPVWFDKKNIFLFIFMVLLFALVPWLRKRCADRDLRACFLVVMVVLSFSAFSQHSAGWVIWAIPPMYLLHESMIVRLSWIHWAWCLSFVLRWSVVSHSPLNDSIAVLFQKFVNWEPEGFRSHMGAIFYWIEEHFTRDTSYMLVYTTQTIFITFSILLAIYYLRSVNVIAVNDLEFESN